ncbi:MAG TPA: acetate/propionate family kinase [Candidatus Bipolaricaulota bacterium]|nr:acetate/propionate family kinase [Candidatus Bipolaricaulota bacterium]
MGNLILIINAGSSSVKFKLFDQNLKKLHAGIVEQISGQSFCDFDGHKTIVKIKNHHEAITAVFLFLTSKKIDLSSMKKVGHRYVHGGEKFYKPLLVNSKNIKELEKLNDLAPLHNPHNLAGIKAVIKLLPQAKNYACFDTAFFHDLPDRTKYYPLPMKLTEKMNIRRYGFHGLSHQFVAENSSKRLNKKLSRLNLITCHLGSGCSISAIQNGKPIDTSMGFTPLEGLMMATRSGDIDPAIVFHLNKKGYKLPAIEKMLNFESGFYGVSGFKDMREILASEKKPAKLALDMFVYRIKKYIGAYAAVLGKVDAIAFTAGIGERSGQIRKLIISGLPIKAKVLVVPANEELMMAKLIC